MEPDTNAMKLVPDSTAGDLNPSSAREPLETLRNNIRSVFLGKPEVVDLIVIGLISRGHILIEDVPGVGKTVLARAIARSINCKVARIQLTPDMLPSDILGVSVFREKSGAFEFIKGPIFANVILADEINRATPRTQSALLEVMNETQISIEGKTTKLDLPFVVIATQNPFEFEGTYFLPESQLDRFAIRVRIGYPTREDEVRIVHEQPDRTALERIQPVMSAVDVVRLQECTGQVRLADVLMSYILDVVEITRKHEHLDVGVSPRGTMSLVRAAQAAALLEGRDYVIPDDVKRLVVPVFAHRVVSRSYAHNGHLSSTEQIVQEIVAQTPVPE